MSTFNCQLDVQGAFVLLCKHEIQAGSHKWVGCFNGAASDVFQQTIYALCLHVAVRVCVCRSEEDGLGGWRGKINWMLL